jgi:3-oxoacyl-[acyl-carrier protein] reductase
MDMTGRVVVITGAGSGIGRATAELVSARGAHIIAIDLTETGIATAEAINASGGRASGFILDVTDRAAVNVLFSQVLREFERIDGLVTSAGIMLNGSAMEFEEIALDRVLTVNFKGTLWCCRAAAVAMMRQRTGSIVTLSSAVADITAQNTAAYAISKAAVVQLTRVLALELAEMEVRVNAVSPGIIESGITRRHYERADESVDEAKREIVLRQLASKSPMNRVGAPDDVAQGIAYLLSDASNFMTGQVLRLNGGAAMV